MIIQKKILKKIQKKIYIQKVISEEMQMAVLNVQQYLILKWKDSSKNKRNQQNIEASQDIPLKES